MASETAAPNNRLQRTALRAAAEAHGVRLAMVML